MRPRRHALALLAFAVALPLAAQDTDRFDYMDVFEIEWGSDPRISPDGSTVVYLRNSMDLMADRRRSELWIVRSDGSGHRRLGEGGTPRWSPDGSKLAYVADGQIVLRWMDTGETATLTQLTQSPGPPSWSPDGTLLAFSMLVPTPGPTLADLPTPPDGAEWAPAPIVVDRFRNRSDGSGYLPHGYRHLFVLPVDGGTPRQVTSGDFDHSSEPVWATDGAALLFSANRSLDAEQDFRNSEIYRVGLADGRIESLTDRDGPDHSPALSPDGATIAYLGYEDRVRTYQVTRLHVMDSDGSGKRVVTTEFDRSVSSPTWSPDGDAVYVQYDDEGNTRIARISLVGEVTDIARDLGGTSYGRPYGGGSYTVAADGTIAFTETTPGRPGEISLVREGAAQRLLTRLNDDLLASNTFGEVEEIWWESSFDGRRIQGWVVRPPDFEPARRYPLLVEIHGGPVSNYGDRFSAEMQLYASAGYVVFYPNPRGSTSYGEEFGDLLYHNYPGQDFDDVMSGVDAVIALGYIDERNLFITGGSAGGIMTAWAVGHTDRFTAAAAQKPVINWYSKTLTADNWYGYFHSRYEGLPWEDPAAYLDFSPISYVGNVTTPTLLIVGDADLRTPISESEQFFHALKYRGVETALVRLPGASHDISRRPSQLIAKVANVLAWFERYRVGERTSMR
ncbi:MAG: S9 family peptidase [Gemmatimonadota bacterium]|nr:S9 family peptidase [Gemmatimonadota bacterium]